MVKTLHALWGMARPLLLVTVSAVYLIGSLIPFAFGFTFNLTALVWGFLALVPVILAAHYVNEYADYETDNLTIRTPFSGGSGMLSRGIGSCNLALKAAVGSQIIGLIFLLIGLSVNTLSLAVLPMWILGSVAGWLYSLPPFRLAWRGWGETINAVLLGVNLPLYGYTVQTGNIDMRVIIGCVPFALLIFILVMATNWADRDADSTVGKRTLSAQLEPQHLRLIYWLALFIAYLVQPFLVGTFLPALVVLSSLPALPLIAFAGTRYTRIHSPLPTVAAMLVLLPLQVAAWILAGL
ncbi:MAG: prenyltransferase [Anaerolineae bacterium]|nr:prenyltransferase [Anaerolineae bacterium]